MGLHGAVHSEVKTLVFLPCMWLEEYVQEGRAS